MSGEVDDDEPMRIVSVSMSTELLDSIESQLDDPQTRSRWIRDAARSQLNSDADADTVDAEPTE